MYVSLYQDKKHSLPWVSILISNFIDVESSCNNFLLYGFHVNVVFFLDDEGLLRVEPYFLFSNYNIHTLQHDVNTFKNLIKSILYTRIFEDANRLFLRNFTMIYKRVGLVGTVFPTWNNPAFRPKECFLLDFHEKKNFL